MSEWVGCSLLPFLAHSSSGIPWVRYNLPKPLKGIGSRPTSKPRSPPACGTPHTRKPTSVSSGYSPAPIETFQRDAGGTLAPTDSVRFFVIVQILMKPILQTSIPAEDSILRANSMLVPDELFGTPELARMIADMEASLDAQLDGVALAAPQIGLLYRIFIVRYDRMRSPRDEENQAPAQPEVGVFINPTITRTSQRRIWMDEGCLSVRTIYGKTHRFERATCRAQDVNGAWFERGGGGILAQAYQHEIDHLNGMLFIDHARDMVTVNRDHDHTHDV